MTSEEQCARSRPYPSPDLRASAVDSFVASVERQFPGDAWRAEWMADESFAWPGAALGGVFEWKRRSGLRTIDRLLASVYEAEDDAFRDSAVDLVMRAPVRRNCGGGDCFFLAASFALFGDEGAAEALRRVAAVYRCRRVESAADFERFLGPGSEWADDHAIQGLACALRASFAFVDPLQAAHSKFSFLDFQSVCGGDSAAALVRASFLACAATTTLAGGHFESFDAASS